MLSEQRPAGEKGSVPLTMVYDSGFDQNMRWDDEKNEFSQEWNQTGEFGAAGLLSQNRQIHRKRYR